MAQYAKQLPVDQNNNPYTDATPAFPSNQSWSGVPVASSTIGISDKSTVIQMGSQGGVALFKWGPSSVTTSNFDGVVTGTPRSFVIPVSIVAAVSVMGANGMNGLYNKVSVFTPSSASVFGAEF